MLEYSAGVRRAQCGAVLVRNCSHVIVDLQFCSFVYFRRCGSCENAFVYVGGFVSLAGSGSRRVDLVCFMLWVAGLPFVLV